MCKKLCRKPVEFDNSIKSEINRIEIKNSNDYYREIENYSKGNVIMLRIVRNGNNLYEAFEIK